MSLAAIANVPSTLEELNAWSFAHMAHHRDIIARIYQLQGLVLPEYSLDPIDPLNPTVWEYSHQAMHNDQNTVLGIQGNDLSSINWQDENELAAWIFLNFNEHYQAGAILELG